MEESQSWNDLLKDVFKTGVSTAVDTFTDPTSAYDPDPNTQVRPAVERPGQRDRPLDDTPGEPSKAQQSAMMGGLSTTQIAIGGAGLALALGLAVYLARA
jgi:hypothetical protein